MFEFAIPIQPTVTNNQAEYEALLRGLQYLRDVGAVSVEVWRFRVGDQAIERPIRMQK
jgi:ribonuclease HI